MEQAPSFRLPPETDVSAFEAMLAEHRSFAYDSTSHRQIRYFDTFDWQLFNRRLILSHAGDAYSLVSFAGDKRISCVVAAQRPTFSWQLPAGALRQQLTPVIKARALLELAHINVDETIYRIMNADEKTVARIAFVEIRMTENKAGTANACYASVRPLRGYDGHARRLAAALSEGVLIDSVEEALYLDALTAAGQSPNNYSSRLDFVLSPDQRADEATKVIMRRLLETIRANEQGIIDDVDIEFLHDYRVAIRRTRSALSQIPGVFPAETTDHFKQAFRTLGRRTNLLRDLDVYLLAESSYRAMLPDGVAQDISPLFELLHSQRAGALRAAIDGLGSDEHEEILATWSAFLALTGANDRSAPNASVPIIDLARKRIDKRYRRIVKKGSYILDHTEDELLHDLRLECKKLRYLLEFFASLFPRKKMTRLIKQLKRLQENLGDFTDLAVQQESLMSMADQLPDNDPRTRRALIATGVLVETLARRQQTVKANFSAIFTQFAAPANQKAFADLFATEKMPKKGKRKKKRKGKAL